MSGILLSHIAQQIGLDFTGEDVAITGVNTLVDASPSELSFLANPKYASQLDCSRAAAVIVPEGHPSTAKTVLTSPHPYLHFVQCVQLFARPQGTLTGHHPQSVIDPEAQVDASATIYPFVTICAGAVVEAGATLFSGVYVGEHCRVGKDTTIYPNCALMAGTQVGARCIIHAGTVLGSDGFGFAQSETGMTKFPQIGRTILEDDVEVGANTTIDRAALGETRIGRGTKIDNLVQLGHNVRVGRNCLLVAQVGIAGSSSLGDGVILAGQVGVAGHIHIGDGCRVGAKSGVGQDLPPKQDVSGIPAVAHGIFLRNAAIAPKLPDMKRRIGRLEKELNAIRQQLSTKGHPHDQQT